MAALVVHVSVYQNNNADSDSEDDSIRTNSVHIARSQYKINYRSLGGMLKMGISPCLSSTVIY